MTANPSDDLAALLERGDTGGVQQFFVGLSEKQRKQLAPLCRATLAPLIEKLTLPGPMADWALRASLRPDLNVGPVSELGKTFLAARLALFCTGTAADVRRYGLPAGPDGEQILQALLERRPTWLERWVTQLLRERPAHRLLAQNHFLLVRRLVDAGLIAEPDTPEYLRHMITCNNDVHATLRDHPAILERTVWRLFELNAVVQGELAKFDFSIGVADEIYTWSWHLARLAEQGRLPRARLLDATLTMLACEATAYHARWYVAFHERLQPTAAEMTERADRYLGLLQSTLPQVVGCALDAVEAIDAAEPLPAGRLAAGLAPALALMDAKRVKGVLKLLTTAVRRESAQAPAAALAACAALGQVKTAIQTAAWEFIEGHGAPTDVELIGRVQSSIDFVAPTLQGRLREWLKGAVEVKTAPAPLAAGAPDLEALRFRIQAVDPTYRNLARLDEALAALERNEIDLVPLAFQGSEIPRLDSERVVMPLDTLDSLLDLLGRMEHHTEDADDYERALDGLSRLCDQRPADFDARVAPLAAQIERVLHGEKHKDYQFWRYWPMLDLFRVAEAWLRPVGPEAREQFLLQARQRGSRPSDVCPGPQEGDLMPLLFFHMHRQREMTGRVGARISVPLLAAPTHRGGWLDPRALVARVATYLTSGVPLGEFDAVLALLRLAPEHRTAALAAARDLPAPADAKFAFAVEFPLALRYALGDDVPIGRTASLWIAAARARSPRGEDARVEAVHRERGPDAGHKACIHIKLAERTDPYANPARYEVTPPATSSIPYSHLSVVRHVPDTTMVGVCDRRMFLLWPQVPEALFARGVRWMVDRQEGASINADRVFFLTPLLDPDVALEQHATMLLALGLTAKEPSVQSLAVDVLTAAIQDGRLDPERLGAAIAEVGAVKLGKYSRWASALQQAAQASLLHAEAARLIIQRVLQGDPASAAREIAPLLELFLELCTRCGRGISAQATWTYLVDMPPGKTAAVARRVLALVGNDDASPPRVLQAELLEHRLARVERWQGTAGK